jgi:branched-chain amino acid transport system ATP-binding protein
MILDIKEINTYYKLSHILFDVTLQVAKGEVIYYLGRNGAGKTTTIRSIMGLTRPGRGSIKFNDLEITNKAPFEICHLGIGWVPSGRRIFPDLTVLENLEVVHRPGVGKTDYWSVKQIFEMFPPLLQLANHKGGQLSGGEKQMLAIGRTLVTNPELLVMDEPSEGLSPLAVKWLSKQIKDLNHRGITIVLTEQNVKLALEVAHRGYIIDSGRIRYEGTVDELKSNVEVKHRYLAL